MLKNSLSARAADTPDESGAGRRDGRFIGAARSTEAAELLIAFATVCAGRCILVTPLRFSITGQARVSG